MPTYVFEADDGERIERNFPMGDFPPLVTIEGKKFRKVICDVGFVVPAYMRAEGSIGSSEDACSRQDNYLKSDRHRKDIQQMERIEKRQLDAKDRLNKHIKSELGDPKVVADKVAKRAKERRDAGLDV